MRRYAHPFVNASCKHPLGVSVQPSLHLTAGESAFPLFPHRQERPGQKSPSTPFAALRLPLACGSFRASLAGKGLCTSDFGRDWRNEMRVIRKYFF